MKEFKGTPGPWSGKDVGICKQDEARLQLGFITTTNSSRRNECAANAHVIVAAPSLLSAIQRLIEVYDDPTGKQWTTTSKREALDKAREAINLALGE